MPAVRVLAIKPIHRNSMVAQNQKLLEGMYGILNDQYDRLLSFSINFDHVMMFGKKISSRKNIFFFATNFFVVEIFEKSKNREKKIKNPKFQKSKITDFSIFEKKIRKIFFVAKKIFFLEELRKKNGYSFDVKFCVLSI